VGNWGRCWMKDRWQVTSSKSSTRRATAPTKQTRATLNTTTPSPPSLQGSRGRRNPPGRMWPHQAVVPLGPQGQEGRLRHLLGAHDAKLGRRRLGGLPIHKLLKNSSLSTEERFERLSSPDYTDPIANAFAYDEVKEWRLPLPSNEVPA
jgi:hypothetical protein